MRLYAWKLAVLAAVVLGGLGTAGGGAEQAAQTVVFVLDCSSSMSTGMGGGVAGENSDKTRFESALGALKGTLDKLSTDGDRRVGVWLFGHRLMWEGGKTDPDLKEQGEYLEQTLGFDVLSNLLPGDDVELVRPIAKFEPEDLPALTQRLQHVKPWGENPLYLSMVKAIDNFERNNKSLDQRIIVITDAANHQGLCKFATGKSQVLDAIEHRALPVHIIRLGTASDVDRQTESELKQIARRSGGSYALAASDADLAKAIDAALSDAPASRETPAANPADATAATGTNMTLAADTKPATLNVRAETPQTVKVQGIVTFYKQGVRGVTLTLTGPATNQEVKTDASGHFTFNGVPAGSFHLKVSATVKNKIRDQEKAFVVDPANANPMIVDVTLD